MIIRAADLKKGQEFRTLLTHRYGTMLQHNGSYGASVVLEPISNNDIDMAEEKVLHPNILVEVI